MRLLWKRKRRRERYVVRDDEVARLELAAMPRKRRHGRAADGPIASPLPRQPARDAKEAASSGMSMKKSPARKSGPAFPGPSGET